MDFLSSMVDYFYFVDAKTRKKIVIGYSLSLLIVVSGIHSLFFMKKKSMEQEKRVLNEKKEKTKRLIAQKAVIESKKKYIELTLKKDQNFRIKEYVMFFLEQNNLLSFFSEGSDTLSENAAKKSFSELIISFELKGISTQQLVTFLAGIEGDDRVYLKEVILKNKVDNKVLDGTFVVATAKLL